MRDKVTTAMECVGIVCIVVGIGWFSVPVSVIALGVALITVGALQ